MTEYYFGPRGAGSALTGGSRLVVILATINNMKVYQLLAKCAYFMGSPLTAILANSIAELERERVNGLLDGLMLL